MSGKRKSILIVLLLLPLFVFKVYEYFQIPADKDKTIRKTEIVIPRGALLVQIADSLKKHGLIRQDKLFLLWAKTLGCETKIKAGLFIVPNDLNYPQLVRFLAEAKPEEVHVTLIEGWGSDRITNELSRKLRLKKIVLDSLIKDADFSLNTGIPGETLNGYLLPDTYTFSFGINEKQVLRYLVRRTIALFKPDSVQARLKQSGYSMHQILTLASIIEGEAMLDSERPVIASVYWNRLRRKMRLQADPTIQFILKDGPRRLLYRDLEIDSPYNTYRYAGLPPGPINNPGKASILAALFPAQTKFLYFVAKGDGSHVFSRTSSEHIRAKAAFDKVRREEARKKYYQKRK